VEEEQLVVVKGQIQFFQQLHLLVVEIVEVLVVQVVVVLEVH